MRVQVLPGLSLQSLIFAYIYDLCEIESMIINFLIESDGCIK